MIIGLGSVTRPRRGPGCRDWVKYEMLEIVFSHLDINVHLYSEKAHSNAFYLLKVTTSTFTLKNAIIKGLSTLNWDACLLRSLKYTFN